MMRPLRARLPALAVLAAGAALTVLACVRSQETHLRRQSRDLAALAGARADLLSVQVERALEAVRSIASLHAASESVEEHEFRAFMAPALEQHPEFHGVGMSFLVPDDRRADYEASRQALHPGFAIRVAGPEGRLIPSPRRDTYLPLHFLEPVDRHAVLGFDLASDPKRWAALERARDTGDAAISDGVRLPDRPDVQGVFIGCALLARGVPVETPEQRRAALVGFASGLIQPAVLLDIAFPAENEPLMAVELRDAKEAADTPPLAARAVSPPAGPQELECRVDLLHGGRHWLLLARPTASFLRARRDRATPIIGLVGLVLSSLAAWGVDRLMARHRSTEQLVRQRSRELAVVGARLQAVLDAATGVAIIATDAAGRIVLANRGAERLLRWTQSAGDRPRSLADFLDPGVALERGPEAAERRAGATVGSDEPFVKDALARIGQEQQSAWRTESGELIPVDCVITRLPGADGSSEGLLFVATDARRRLTEESVLRRARDEAEAASKAKSDFLARMSHELRTPLNSVIGFASVLSRNKEGRLTAEDLQFVSRIRENGLHLLGLIEDILDLSRVEAGRLEVRTGPTDIAALAHEVAAQFEPQVSDKGLGLRVEAPRAPAFAETDASRLRQVLINLVGNAVKFTDSGEVVLRVRPSGEGGWIAEIVDTGPGIPEADIPRIFEPFRQAHEGLSRPHGGTGLGLAISRSLCELLGHRLEVESQAGRGSTFRVHLDATRGSADLRPAG